MSAPVATSGRVAGVTGWSGNDGRAERRIGKFRIVVWYSTRAPGWFWDVDSVGSGGLLLSGYAEGEEKPGAAAGRRVRILAESALEAHLVEALAALRGTA